MNKHLLLCLGLMPMATGCATIVRGGTQDLTINSSPPGASYEIRDNRHPGNTPVSGVTPGTVSLKKGAGYFKGGKYTVTVSKPGYSPTSVNVDSNVSGWYLGGNLIFGGLIGYLAVDPASGAMWTLAPSDMQVGLVPLQSAQNPLPVTAEPVASAPVMPPVAVPVTAPMPIVTPGPVQRAAVQPVTRSPIAAVLSPGEARAAQPTVVRARPKAQSDIAQAVPAGAPLQLQVRQINGDGAWWFAEYQGVSGWVSENGLVQ